MAQYHRQPTDGTKTSTNTNRTRREPLPWAWLGLGTLITLVVLGVAFALVSGYLARPPEEQAAVPGPTVIRLTAPPRPTVAATEFVPTITPEPTFTPAPTRDPAVAPPEITPGFYAAVVNTGGVGVTVRGGPSTSNQPVTIAGEGAILLILGGPTAGGEFQWWQVRLQDGTEGWVAGDFLEPSAAPSP